MRIGIFGGSFDPPHLGHVLGCLWVVETGQVDQVIMVPVARHAFGKAQAVPFEHRLELCRIATQRLSSFVEVSDVEGRRPGTSYMIDTLRSLQQERPEASFRLIVGSDVAAEVGQWRQSDVLLREAPLLELPRPRVGTPVGEIAGALPTVSSSLVRECLRAGRSVQNLLSSAVQDYIRKHHLYSESIP